MEEVAEQLGALLQRGNCEGLSADDALSALDAALAAELNGEVRPKRAAAKPGQPNATSALAMGKGSGCGCAIC
jgi:hypothetical protein